MPVRWDPRRPSSRPRLRGLRMSHCRRQGVLFEAGIGPAGRLGYEMSTKLPLARAAQALNAELSATSGRTITFPSTRPFVGASGEHDRLERADPGGEQVEVRDPAPPGAPSPYCSFFALIPHSR